MHTHNQEYQKCNKNSSVEEARTYLVVYSARLVLVRCECAQRKHNANALRSRQWHSVSNHEDAARRAALSRHVSRHAAVSVGSAQERRGRRRAARLGGQKG